MKRMKSEFKREGKTQMPRSRPKTMKKRQVTPPKDPVKEAELKYLGDLDAMQLEFNLKAA